MHLSAGVCNMLWEREREKRTPNSECIYSFEISESRYGDCSV